MAGNVLHALTGQDLLLKVTSWYDSVSTPDGRSSEAVKRRTSILYALVCTIDEAFTVTTNTNTTIIPIVSC